MSDWQPIETAPREWGEEFDVWCNGERVTNVGWGLPSYGPKIPAHVYKDGYDCNGCVLSVLEGATHWMPLPAPPKDENGTK